MSKFVKKVMDKLIAAERSPERLARSCCVGIAIATSPFITLQTWIAFPIAWIFGLNTIVIITVLYVVNNPFTMVPIIVADYACGYWLIDRLMGIDLVAYNPSWVAWINAKIGPYLQQYLGVTSFCFWCYIIGGLIFCAICSLPFYVPLRNYFRKKLAPAS